MATAIPATYITPPAYAARLGIKPSKVIGYIRAGELRAVDVSVTPGVGNPRYRISPEAIAEFEAARSSSTSESLLPVRPKGRRAGRRYAS